MKKKLSIIIVNYNVTDLLLACIQSIEKYAAKVDYEIIVIDNCSTDNSWQKLRHTFPKVTFIALEENLGFSKANNIAATKAQGEYILLLNPDTELENYGLDSLLEFADGCDNLGCIGVRMHNLAGDFLPESKRSVPNIINSFEKLFLFTSRKNNRKTYYRNDINENEIACVEVITGAFLLMKRELYLDIGGLDERYFMYGEDIDLCYTLINKGFQNYYYGAYSILHHKGQSTVKDLKYLSRFYGAMFLFLEKYYKHKNRLKYLFLLQGLKLKYFIERLKLKKAKEI
ncbi:glycosyltransferase family 2 protein [Riemerella anatipestifer]|uniref:Glycosyltransferase family 2 protein n=1 Tax=Riemerella anatipestifer TaxID=34085 RepID=A0AAP6LKF0_RIEAN|nr:glycosyltransferase family 2 protein [Riemerella anatipestifer]MCD5968912.1 glycosyltransferase family 2 protein [Riemerella anatipestifer]MCU7540316.1 glycosyltransferase family 2 protein [Riemerella anatipestifer]MCU7571067.1 glycosyltransferase family 2 protein [Riemerella anatipestifer]MCU7597656.1 glycosyltransferase family 2 protein [Riemerella anatipestifer]MCW0494139.1 glycosyltransferase family 2 protein [Riemerella anatipestifer]